MKVTKKEIAKILKNGKNDKEIKAALQYVFSFEENIDVFSVFFFPDIIKTKVPEFHKEIYSKLFSFNNEAIAAPRGHAKQLADSTPILTTKGWKTHGDLNIGDYVFHPSGKPTKVIGKNTKTDSDYVVTTRDGEQIRCSGEHEWTVYDRNKKKYVTVETKDMLCGGEKRSRFQLPLIHPLLFPYKKLELDPYFLGLWLGDGSSTKSCITHDKRDMDSINAIPYYVSGQYTHKDTGVYSTYFNHQNITKKLKKLEIFNNKRIPEKYFSSSLSQRLELMAGLIDSDGHIFKKRGRVRFSNTNLNLIKDVERLALSLGSRPYIVSCKEGKKRYPGGHICKYKKIYQLCFDPVIEIPTKLERKRSNRKPMRRRLGIKSVKYEPNGEKGNCIMVDSNDGQYLAGKRLIPTHNSTLALVYNIFNIVNQRIRYIVYVSENHKKTTQFISPIRMIFANNSLLRYVYGDFSSVAAKDANGRDREDCYDINGVRVESVSFEKNIRGLKDDYNNRPQLILLDDIENDERVRNPELRLKDEEKLNKVIIPSLSIDGVYKFIGTILHHDSLLMKKIKSLGGSIYSACDSNFEGLLWPEYWSIDKLKAQKKEIGSVAFRQEFLNDPAGNINSIIDPKWIELCKREDISCEDANKINFENKALGVDFAFSDAINADKSAYVGIGKKDDYFYIIHQETAKGKTVLQQMNHIKFTLQKMTNYDVIGLEENSIKSVSSNIGSYKLPIKLFWMGSSDPPKKQKNAIDFKNKRHTVGKQNAIFRLATAFENKQIIIPYKTEKDKLKYEELLAELTSWELFDGKIIESGVHPDIPIALIFAIESLNLTKKTLFY